jgi:uncharacterized membrane protein YgcG
MSFIDRIFPSTAASAGVDAAGPQDAAPGPSPDAAAHACPECGTPAAADQEWCLECGSRIEESGSRWHQPAAVMASVGLILVAGLALALSEVAKDAEVAKAKTVRKYVAAAPPPAAPVPASPTPDTPKPPSNSGSSTPQTSPNPTDTPQSSPSDTGGAAISSPDTSGSSSGLGSTDTGSTGSTGSSGGGGSTGGGGSSTTTPAPPPVQEWPAGKKAYSVILLSTTSKDEAEALARKARAKGVPAGILDTSKYKNLSDGLWMVWAGRFGTEDEAYAAADGYSAKGFTGESVEYIREKGSGDSSGDGSSSNGSGSGSGGSNSNGNTTSTNGKTTSTETSPSATTTTDTTGGEG